MHLKEKRGTLFLMDTWWQLLSVGLIAHFRGQASKQTINSWAMSSPEDLVNNFL